MKLACKKTEHWEKQGKLYGYPKCCIKAFIANNSDSNNIIEPTIIQECISNGSGFIPCSHCCWKVLSNQCKLADLIKDREEENPFPE